MESKRVELKDKIEWRNKRGELHRLEGSTREKILFYDTCVDMQTSGYIEQCEVIGNIYENPELLNFKI